MTQRFFINYRHEDSWGTASHLYRKLAMRFGAENVFYDNATLRYGEDWTKEISSSVERAAVLIALIGPRWRSILADRARRGGDDYVLREIGHALRAGHVTVVPLRVDEAALPTADELPDEVCPLLGLESVRIHHTDLLDESACERLLARLAELARDTG